MQVQGSCHCGAVHFSVRCPYPVPYNRCYCSICRKTAGGGGYAINLGGEYASLEVQGGDALRVYQAAVEPGASPSPALRHFCGTCGSALWVHDPRWPDLVHPFASAIDTDLPVAPSHTHMMLESKAGWVRVPHEPADALFEGYPNESLAQWHQRRHLESDR